MTGSARIGFAVFAGLTVLAVLVGRATLEPIPPTIPPMIAIPPLIFGIYLVVSSTWIQDLGLYGATIGRLPAPVHFVAQAVGFAVVGGSVLMMLRLPPDGASDILRALPALDAGCRGEPGTRADRMVLPRVQELLALRDSQAPSLQDQLDRALRATLTRCAGQARDALLAPDGAHISWIKLRSFLSEHPELHELPPDDPLWTIPWRERQMPVRAPRPVEVFLE